MKLSRRFKVVLLLTLALMYSSGVLTWALSYWFLSHTEFGDEPSASRTPALQIHSVVSLWFMVVYGYLFHAHIEPSWRKRRRRKSGGLLTGMLAFLIVTVPGLFYLTDERAKHYLAWVHTYVGLTLVLVFVFHYYAREKR